MWMASGAIVNGKAVGVMSGTFRRRRILADRYDDDPSLLHMLRTAIAFGIAASATH